ncbi:MAG: hypothetical protein R6X20_00565 [Phycisphaerae bacterium]
MQRLLAAARPAAGPARRPAYRPRRRAPAGVLVAMAMLAPLVLCAGCGWLGGEEETAEGWWAGLSTAAKVFFGIAFVFSALFLWQFIMTLVGLAGGGADAEVGAGDTDVHFGAEAGEADAGALDAHVGDVDVGAEVGDVDVADADAHGFAVSEAETTISFKLLSLRSIITGGMLFGWAGALYVQEGVPLGTAMLLAMAWAAAGALVVAALMYGMRRMQETGNRRLATCVGQPGSVYMDIPKSGTGQVRTVVSGAVAFVPARTADGKPLKVGTPVRVRRLLDASTVEVEAVKDQ